MGDNLTHGLSAISEEAVRITDCLIVKLHSPP
jgi:hypothetical protein